MVKYCNYTKMELVYHTLLQNDLQTQLSKIKMVLREETKFGLTYGQVLATFMLLIALGGTYVAIKVEIQQLRSEQEEVIERIVKMENVYINISETLMKPMLNENRISEIEKDNEGIKTTVETIRKENREEHGLLMQKLDKLLNR